MAEDKKEQVPSEPVSPEEAAAIAKIKALGKKGVTFHTDSEGGVHTSEEEALEANRAIEEAKKR